MGVSGLRLLILRKKLNRQTLPVCASAQTGAFRWLGFVSRLVYREKNETAKIVQSHNLVTGAQGAVWGQVPLIFGGFFPQAPFFRSIVI